MSERVWVTCIYAGNGETIPACKNQTRETRLFCNECLAMVSTRTRNNWRKAFNPPVPYNVAIRERRYILAICDLCEGITNAKLQSSLFDNPANGRKAKEENGA